MKPNWFISILCLALAAAWIGSADAPSTRPTTAPTGFAIAGNVQIHAQLDLQKFDPTRVIVYLDTDPRLDALPPPSEHAVIAQKNKEFVPKFLAISKGTAVEFPNWDHISHNVFSRSAAAPAFDLDRYPYGVSKTRTFAKVGIVQLFCNIHPQMRAMVFVTPNPFFTHCDRDGDFQLTGIPAGHYTLAVWQERCGTRRMPIDAGPGQDSAFSLSLSEDRDSILANEPPARRDSYGIERGLGIKREKLDLPVVTESHPAPASSDPCPDCK